MISLKPWHAIAVPHIDIREGRLDESVFAANLWQVVIKRAPSIYLDPTTFFEKTYLTDGLRRLLRRVEAGLQGNADAGDRILSLQTAFGGGKTHALVALWHLTQEGCQLKNKGAASEVWEAASVGDRSGCPIAVFTNQTCDPVQGRSVENGSIELKTLWGEIAYQLGGKDAYEIIRPNDESRTAPKGLFSKVLEKVGPCVILIDELADYCCVAAGVDVGGGTLADQTISFIQELTEAVQGTEKSVLVATLPASALEVANSQIGETILNNLQKRMGRMGADMKPVGDNEIYEVIRKRLFDSVGDITEIKTTVDEYVTMYRGHLNEVPSETIQEEYRARMMRSYPFHPQLIDALHTRWGSDPNFQRTRGVLRLLAAIVADLYKRRNNSAQSQPLIQPCHLDFQLDPLISQVTKLWGQNFQTVVAADIIGESSNAEKADNERGAEYVPERITAGVASAVFLGSFGGGTDSGWTTEDVHLACGRPGLNWNYTDGALNTLEQKAFYLHVSTVKTAKRYWFGVKPTLNKLVVQYRQSIEPEQLLFAIREEVKKQVQASSGVFSRILFAPKEDLADQKELTLIVLDPKDVWEGKGTVTKKKVLTMSKTCGSKDRIYRNTLLFLVAYDAGYVELENQMRDLQAYQRIQDEYGMQLDPSQKEELRARISDTKDRLTQIVGTTYSLALHVNKDNEVEELRIPNGKSTFKGHLERVWEQLNDEEWIIKSVGIKTLENAGLWPTEEKSINMREATEAFLRFTDKPMLGDIRAVAKGISELCRKRQVGIGYGKSLNEITVKEIGKEILDIDPLDDATWILAPFVEQATPMVGYDAQPSILSQEKQDAMRLANEVGMDTGTPSKNYHRVRVHGRVPLENWSDMFASFISPLRGHKPVINIDITVEAMPGSEIEGKIVDQGGIRESAKQIGLDVDVE